jgi:hypothetical protein
MSFLLSRSILLVCLATFPLFLSAALVAPRPKPLR